MKYLGPISDPLDYVNKKYVDANDEVYYEEDSGGSEGIYSKTLGEKIYTAGDIVWNQMTLSGTQIASFRIGDEVKAVFAPTSGGSSYTPILRMNNVDYAIQRWEYTTISGKTGINFVYLDGADEDTLFVPITPPTLSMSIDSTDTKKLNISYL